MISTTITNGGIALGASSDAAACRVRVDAAVKTAATTAVMAGANTFADHRITAELRVSSFSGGYVWLRPAALDVFVPTTPGHPTWSPPT